VALTVLQQQAYRNWSQLISAAASTRTDTGGYAYTVTDLVSAASELARAAGSALSFAESSAISQLFGQARRSANAAAALTTADLTSSIESGMIGEWPTAAPLDIQAIQPEYMAKASFTYMSALGEEMQGWVTITGINNLPASTGTLRSMLQGKAMSAYTQTQGEGGTPKTGAEIMTAWGDFTSIQLYAL
jgi:hypothetical protein